MPDLSELQSLVIPDVTAATEPRRFASPRRPADLASLLDSFGLPSDPGEQPRRRGRPRKDRTAVTRSLIARALLDLPNIVALVDRLHRDPELRQACGWKSAEAIPSCATFRRLSSGIVCQLPEALRAQVQPYYPSHIAAEADNALSDNKDQAWVAPAVEMYHLRDAVVALVQHGAADLTLQQFGTLLACHLANGPQSIRSLQQRLGLSRPELKHTLDRLDRLRLTRASRDRSGRRRYLVHRTKRGTQFLNLLFHSINASQGAGTGGNGTGTSPGGRNRLAANAA